ncbi:formylglycine-generating enzyme [Gammaproteobacteria bacterium]
MPYLPPLMRALMRAVICACPWLTAIFFGLAAALAQADEINKIGITMVNIPAGRFAMGSCKGAELISPNIEENKKRAFLDQSPIPDVETTCLVGKVGTNVESNETPQHYVNVSAFRMGKTEVTLGQFKKFLIGAERTELADGNFMKYNTYDDDAPVVDVSWNDAEAFIAWLNKIDGGGYRLPSEAEWEYACRAGSNETYCGSNNIDAVAWYAGNSNGHQHPVGAKQANAFGLYDMSGNVWEWVQGCWHNSYDGAPTDGSVWTSGCTNDDRVLRSGSWDNIARGTRAASRSNLTPDFRSNSSGFRIARSR